MIDLHCHILPGIDDGASNLKHALDMAKIAEKDGIVCTACTPHIYPGVYENNAPGIMAAVATLQGHIREAGLQLQLTYGADTHLVPDMLKGIRDGRIPTLNGSRYFLLEPSHHSHPPQFLHSVANVLACGYVPLITHPERLTWTEEFYDEFTQLVTQGAWIQITAGALLGKFGRYARYLAEQMLDDGIVHVIATDAHDVQRRVPLLAEGREAAAKLVGKEEAQRMVQERPQSVLDNADPKDVVPALVDQEQHQNKKDSWFAKGFWNLLGFRNSVRN